MTALLLLLFAFAQPHPSSENCEGLFGAAGGLYVQSMDKGLSGEELDRLAGAARRARGCYGAGPRDRVANLYAWEAYALLERGRVFEAETALEGYFSGYERDQPVELTAYLHGQRASVYLATGRPLSALETYRQMAVLSPEGDPGALAELALNTALAYDQLSDLDGALAELERAERVLSGTPPADIWLQYLHARVWSQRADLLLRRSSLEADGRAKAAPDAEVAAGQAAEVFEALEMPADLAVALTLMAEAQSLAGRYEEALKTAERALAVARGTGQPGLAVRAEYKLARILAQSGHYEAGIERMERAHGTAARLGDADLARRIGMDVGLVKERLGDVAGAERAFREAIRITEAQRGTLGTGLWAAQAFSGWDQPYRGLVRTLVAQGRDVEAFLTLETMRARRLHELRRAARLQGGLPPALRVQADRLAGELRDVRGRLLGSLPGRARTEAEAEELTLTRAYDALFGAAEAVSAPSLQAIQAHLDRRSAVLLSYFLNGGDVLFGRQSPVYVFRVTGDAVHVVRLRISVPDVERMMAASGLGEAGGAAQAGSFDLRPLHSLHEALAAPVLGGVAPGTPLIVVPDGVLFQLPFAALVRNAAGAFDYAGADFLIERHPVSTEMAAALLVEEREDALRDYDAVALGRAVFSTEDAGSGLPSLPGSGREVMRVCGLFGLSRCAMDDAATETAVYDLLPKTSILHLASHTQPSGDGLGSALVLSGGGGADGLLHAHELLRRPAAVPLVVLTNCASASGRHLGPEGVLGLPYAFRASGAHSVVATLWPVDDGATAQIVEAFYRDLRAGAPKDVALRRAQVAYLRETRGARLSPFFWAAPVLYGDAGAVPLRGGSGWTWWVAFAGAGAAAAAFVLLRRRRMVAA